MTDTETHDIAWNPSDAPYLHPITVSLGDTLNFHCPEIHYIEAYSVNSTSYKNCDFSQDPTAKRLFVCRKPNKKSKRTIKVLAVNPFPGSLEFSTNTNYQIITTSGGLIDEIGNEKGGFCKSHRLKMEFFVRRGETEVPDREPGYENNYGNDDDDSYYDLDNDFTEYFKIPEIVDSETLITGDPTQKGDTTFKLPLKVTIISVTSILALLLILMAFVNRRKMKNWSYSQIIKNNKSSSNSSDSKHRHFSSSSQISSSSNNNNNNNSSNTSKSKFHHASKSTELIISHSGNSSPLNSTIIDHPSGSLAYIQTAKLYHKNNRHNNSHNYSQNQALQGPISPISRNSQSRLSNSSNFHSNENYPIIRTVTNHDNLNNKSNQFLHKCAVPLLPPSKSNSTNIPNSNNTVTGYRVGQPSNNAFLSIAEKVDPEYALRRKSTYGNSNNHLLIQKTPSSQTSGANSSNENNNNNNEFENYARKNLQVNLSSTFLDTIIAKTNISQKPQRLEPIENYESRWKTKYEIQCNQNTGEEITIV